MIMINVRNARIKDKMNKEKSYTERQLKKAREIINMVRETDMKKLDWCDIRLMEEIIKKGKIR